MSVISQLVIILKYLMPFGTIPHPPNAAWMPPIDPNDEVKIFIKKGSFITIIIDDRIIIQIHSNSGNCQWNGKYRNKRIIVIIGRRYNTFIY